MANTLSLGLVIGGAVSPSIGNAFKNVESRIKRLSEQGAKARVLQSTIGETMRLRDEWKKAHDAGIDGADKLRGKLDRNLGLLKDQGVEVRNLSRAYQTLGNAARGSELKALGHSQISQGKAGMRSTLGMAAATTASLAIPTKISGDYQAQIRQMAIWAHTAGTADEAALAKGISEVAKAKGMGQQKLAAAIAGLIEKGVDWEESLDYAPLVADLVDGQGMEETTIATLIKAFKVAGIEQKDMGAILGQVAAAGDIGAFGPKEMAKYLPSLLGTINRLGMEGPEAVRFLGASLQSQYDQTQDAAAAATNMDNLLNAVISSTSQERFAKEGFDLTSSLIAAQKAGKASNPVDAFILLSEQLIRRQDPAKAQKMDQLKAKILAAKDGSAEEDQAFVALMQASGLASVVSDKSASAGLLAQIKSGAKIKADMAEIKATDGRTKIEQDAAKARETSNAKWSTATDSMAAMMVSIGDAVRPITNLVTDGLSSLGYGLSSLCEKYPGLIRGTTLLAGGVVAAGLALNAFKIGKGLMNLGRGSLIGNPNVVQLVRVVNSAGLTGSGESSGGRGNKGKGKARTPGIGAGRYIKGAGVLSAVSAGLQGIDTYQNAETRDEKAEGYGDAAGTFAGSLGGAAIGAAIGTAVLPVIGTAVGSIIGGIIGAWGGGAAGGSLGKAMFGNGGLDRMPAQGPLMLPNAGSQLGPRLGDVARSFEKPAAAPGALLKFKPVAKTTPAKVDQRLTFAPKLEITVQGDVKDPQQLADAMMPYLQSQFEEFAQQAERRSLFDAPHIN
ncbi:phage tail tape measure protein [Pseudomonas sp. NA-150]|uniref:phage tail tape measure protein n=1 Tax=Pseudomonas sp. NA-150 TaxID=3367525 RepID=UPI0037C84CE5